MEKEKKNDFDEVIRRFFTKGEALDESFLEKLKGEEFTRAKKELLRLRRIDLQPDREYIWQKIQKDVSGRRKRQRIIRYMRYAALFLLPLSLAIFLFLNQEKVISVELTQNYDIDTTEIHKAYLVLAGGSKIELSSPHQDTIRREDGQLLAVDTLGTLVYNVVKAATPELSYHTIIVPRGGEYTLVLSDGSRVRLNADSELRFPIEFASAERRVFLKGEGYFEVQRDTTKPFRVEVDDKALVEVLGTEFNINSYPENNKIYTTLVEGSVKVAGLSTDNVVILKPDEQAAFSLEGIDVNSVDPEDYVSWVRGRFYFEKMSLEDILLQLERWYDLQVFWASKELKTYEFTGAVWRDCSVHQIFDMIEKTTEVHFTVSGRTVTVDFPK